jgi:hypothetical protein
MRTLFRWLSTALAIGAIVVLSGVFSPTQALAAASLPGQAASVPTEAWCATNYYGQCMTNYGNSYYGNSNYGNPYYSNSYYGNQYGNSYYGNSNYGNCYNYGYNGNYYGNRYGNSYSSYGNSYMYSNPYSNYGRSYTYR